MASKQANRIRTDVYHDDKEQAVRARSQHSRSAHIPATDDDGNVVFDDGNPMPECECDPDTDTEWILRPIRLVSNREKCTRCFDADAVAKQNKKNGGSTSLARQIRDSDDWGSDE